MLLRQFLLMNIMIIVATNVGAESRGLPTALYAEISGTVLHGTRIYAGGADIQPVHGRLKALLIRVLIKPRTSFYDAKGIVLKTECIQADDIKNDGAFVREIQSRLTELPEAAEAHVAWFKARGIQAVELYDVSGHRIAQTGFGSTNLGKNQQLSPDVIEELKDKISNPELLKTMRISQVKPSDEWIRECGFSIF